MVIKKQPTIMTADFESAYYKTLKQIDDSKHMADAQRKEAREILEQLKNSLVKYKREDIEVYEWMDTNK